MPYKSKKAQREANRRSYARNKESVGDKNKTYKTFMRQKWREYKATLACVVCGENEPAALDFHHVVRDPSNRKLYELLRNGAYAAAYEEIKKCIVLCANCHRKEHQRERDEKKKGSRSSPDTA